MAFSRAIHQLDYENEYPGLRGLCPAKDLGPYRRTLLPRSRPQVHARDDVGPPRSERRPPMET